MIRVLHVFHNMGNGGVENFVMNYYRFIDREKVQFDFLTSVDEPGYFDEEIQKLGGRLYHAYPKKKNPLLNFRDIKKIVKENNFQIVHRHTGSCISNIDLLAAKRGGCKTIISHSHATSAGNKILHYLARFIFQVKCEKFACSEEAGKWLFGKRLMDKNKVHIINNAINVEKYMFNQQKREDIRKRYNVVDKNVIGHIGSFTKVKNHTFVVDIFKEIKKVDKKAILWLIGDGDLRAEIEQKVESLNLKDDVIFWGNRTDVSELLQGIDKFVFPSLKEGFGIVALEAQCAGIPCYVSEDVIPRNVNVSNKVKFIDLDKTSIDWATEIINDQIIESRADAYKNVIYAGYDIRDAAKNLEQRYLQYAKR